MELGAHASGPPPSLITLPWPYTHNERVRCLIMADSVLSQSSQDALRSLDEQLKECAPLDEYPGEQGHGLDYAVRIEEAIKVIITRA